MACEKNPALTSTEKNNLLKKSLQAYPPLPDNEMVAPLQRVTILQCAFAPMFHGSDVSSASGTSQKTIQHT